MACLLIGSDISCSLYISGGLVAKSQYTIKLFSYYFRTRTLLLAAQPNKEERQRLVTAIWNLLNRNPEGDSLFNGLKI